MKKSLLLGAVFGLMSFSAYAADLALPVAETPAAGGSYSGFVEVSANASDYEYWGDSYEPWVGFGGAAALAYQLDDSMSIGIDLKTWSATESEDDYYSAFATQAALHLDWQIENYSVGGFAGILAISEEDGESTDYNAIAGLEAKTALADNVLIGGQIGLVKQVKGYYDMGDVGFGNLDVSFFPTDNIKLSASIGGIFGQVGDDDGETAKTLTYSLEAAYKFDDSPISIFARYSGYQDYDYFNDEGAGSGQTISVGARFSFDGESLKDQASKVNTVQGLDALSWLRFDGW